MYHVPQEDEGLIVLGCVPHVTIHKTSFGALYMFLTMVVCAGLSLPGHQRGVDSTEIE